MSSASTTRVGLTPLSARRAVLLATCYVSATLCDALEPAVIDATLEPSTSNHPYSVIRINDSSVPTNTSWFRLDVSPAPSAPSPPGPCWDECCEWPCWFQRTPGSAGGSASSGRGATALQEFAFKAAPSHVPSVTTQVVLEAYSVRGGLGDDAAAKLLGRTAELQFHFDDQGFARALSLVNFSVTERRPGQLTISATADNATAWKQAQSVAWSGYVNVTSPPTATGPPRFIMDNLQSTQVYSAKLQLGLNLSYSLPGLYFVGVYGVFNGDYSGGAGEHPAIGTKTEGQFPLDPAGVFQPVAIIIPFENGTEPSLPPRFSGIVHVCQPLPGDTRLALRTSQITVFNGGSVYLPVHDLNNGRAPAPDFVELDVPAGLTLLDQWPSNTAASGPDHYREYNVSVLSAADSSGGPLPAGYVRVRLLKGAGRDWTWLNQAVKLQMAIDPNLCGRSFPHARIRAYNGVANGRRKDNWQPLALKVVKLKPITLPKRLRSSFGWDYAAEFPTNKTLGLDGIATWRALGFNTVPAIGAGYPLPAVGWPGVPVSMPGELLTPQQRAADKAWSGLRYEINMSPFQSAGFTAPPYGLGSFNALALPPKSADSDQLPNGFNFSAHGLSAKEEAVERAKWKAALVFHNATGVEDLSYDGFFFKNDLRAVGAIVNYTQADYLRMDIERFEHSLDEWVRVGYLSANFAPRKQPGESDGAASVRLAAEWMRQITVVARAANPRIVPDLYDVSARYGKGFQVNTWAGLMNDGFVGASPCVYFRMNCLDQLASQVRAERLAIGDAAKTLRPTM